MQQHILIGSENSFFCVSARFAKASVSPQRTMATVSPAERRALERKEDWSQKIIDLSSDLARCITEADLPPLNLVSPLGRKASEEVAELEDLHRILQAEGIPGLRAALKARELERKGA